MQLCFSKFRFRRKTAPKSFYRYRIISNDPYSDKNSFNGNSMRYQILQARENRANGRRMFIYVLDNEYLLSYEKIPFIPKFEQDVKLELINEKEYFPISPPERGTIDGKHRQTNIRSVRDAYWFHENQQITVDNFVCR